MYTTCIQWLILLVILAASIAVWTSLTTTHTELLTFILTWMWHKPEILEQASVRRRGPLEGGREREKDLERQLGQLCSHRWHETQAEALPLNALGSKLKQLHLQSMRPRSAPDLDLLGDLLAESFEDR